MAYIANQDDENQQGSTLNTLAGQDPMLQQQQAQENAQIAPETTSAQSATIGTSSPTPSSQSQSQASQAPSGGNQRRGSGMRFSNIRKYVQANKPATQRMAGRATQTVQNKAQNIGQQVAQREQQTREQIAQAQQARQQGRSFAEQQVQRAMNLGAGQQLSDQDAVSRFRQIATGEEAYADQIGPFDIAEQQRGSEQLGQLADSQRTAAGRGELLRQTFGTMGQQYGRGMRDLDNRLLGGTRPALRNLIEGTTEAATGLQENIRQTREAVTGDISAEQTADEAMREALMNQLTGGRSGIMSEVEAETQRINQQRDLLNRALQGQLKNPAEIAQAEELLRQEFGEEESFDQYLQARQEAADRIKGLDVARLIGQGGWLTDRINQAREWDVDQVVQDRLSNNQDYQILKNQYDQFLAARQGQELTGRNAVTDSAYRRRLQEMEDSIRQDALINANPTRRAEQAGQIYNELGRLTSKISGEDLALLGMDRQDLQDAIYKDLGLTHKGHGGGQVVDYSRLYDTLENLTSSATMDRGELLNQFARQAARGKLQGANIDLVGAQDPVTAREVATAEQRARLAALGQLADQQWGLQGQRQFGEGAGGLGRFGDLQNVFMTGAEGRNYRDMDARAGAADRWYRLRDL